MVRGCVAVLRGLEPDRALLLVLGGSTAQSVLRDDSRADAEMWARIWATRGLLWALDESTVGDASAAIVHALHDEAWRVREKAAQVAGRHMVDEALEELLVLRESDPVGRVRSAADRATRRLTVA